VILYNGIMDEDLQLLGLAGFPALLIILLAIWEIIWKGKALMKAAKREEKGWFWAILVINTLGLLPIAYLYYFSKKKK